LRDMRPGSLTRQYRIPEKKQGGYYQISYTHRMKSRTRYVHPEQVAQLRREIRSFKRFKALTQEWVDLSLQRSQLKLQGAAEACGGGGPEGRGAGKATAAGREQS